MTRKCTRLEISNPSAQNFASHDLHFFIFFLSFSGHGCLTRKRTRLEISNPSAQNFDLLYFSISGCAGGSNPASHDLHFFIFFSSFSGHG